MKSASSLPVSPSSTLYSGNAVTLRAVERDDRDRLARWMNDPRNAVPLGRSRPISFVEHERWFERVVQDPAHVFLSIEDRETGGHVGVVWLWSIHPQHRTAELRIVVGEAESRGKGLGSDAVRGLLQFAFRRMNLHKVFLFVMAGNEPALKAFARNGFRVEGTLREEFFADGSYRDVLRMGILRAEYQEA